MKAPQQFLLIAQNFSTLQVNPKENLPQQICDLCIVQLNVSYNFKRLALKNDFQIRQYMIENGISLTKDEDGDIESTTTALEIHQIQHNVIRTNRYRPIAAPELRRNSTTSSLSGASTMIINGRENDATTNNAAANNFVTPKPMCRPIQVKIEPVDPDEAGSKDSSPVTSSPSNVSEPASIVTIYSSTQSEKKAPPMVVINGVINNSSFPDKPKPDTSRTAAPLSVKLTRRREEIRDRTQLERPLRSIRKESADVRKSKRKIVEAVKAKVKPKTTAKKNVKTIKKSPNVKVVTKNEMKTANRPRGRPPKPPGAPKLIYKKRTQPNKKRS